MVAVSCCAATQAWCGEADLIANGGFEEGIRRWGTSTRSPYGAVPAGRTYRTSDAKVELDRAVRHAGRASVRLTGTSPDDRAVVSTWVQLEPGTRYMLTVWVKSANVHAQTVIRISRDIIWNVLAMPMPNRDWQRYQCVFKADRARTQLYLSANHLGGVVWFDDVSLREATAAEIQAERERTEIVKLRAYRTATALVERSRATGIIACPDAKPYRRIARRIQEAVAEATGVTLSVHPHSDVGEEEVRAFHVIALGHLGTNNLLARLYCRQQIFTDRAYPGPGGFELRTVEDPWGRGKNVILVGGSDPEGVGRAADKLLVHIRRGRDVILPQLMEIELAGQRTGQKGGEAEARKRAQGVYERTQREKLEFSTGGSNYVTRVLRFTSGDAYFRTGNEPKGHEFRFLLNNVIAYFKEHPDAFTLEDLWVAVMAWDRIDDSPVFTDGERLDVTNFFLAAARNTYQKRGQSWRSRDGILWGHPLDHALSCYFAAEYIWRYYKRDECRQWMDVIERILRTNAHAVLMPIDEINYQLSSMRFALHSSVTRGDFEYFRTGFAKQFADRAAAYADNVRGIRSYGVWFLKTCAWYHRDGRYCWLTGRLGSPKWDGEYREARPFVAGVPPVEPVDLLGLRVVPLDKTFYDMAPRNYGDARPETDVSRGRAFHAISFRSGFGPDDSFLLIDGCSRGLHRRHDGNAIIWYGSKGESFLGQGGPYEHIAPKYQNGLRIVCNGQSQFIPPYASLDVVGDFQDCAFVRTSLTDYANMDWHRSIWWLGDRGVLIIDELAARSAGDFSVQRQFYLDGDVRYEAGCTTLRRKRALFALQNLDGAAHKLDGLDTYIYAPASASSKVLRQVRHDRLDSGQRLLLANLLSVTGLGAGSPSTPARIGEHVFALGGAQPCLLGLAPNGFGLDAIRLNGEAFCISADRCTLVEGTSFSWAGTSIESDAPVLIDVDWRKGLGLVFAGAERRIRLSGVGPGPVCIDGVPIMEADSPGEVLLAIPQGRHVLRFRASLAQERVARRKATLAGLRAGPSASSQTIDAKRPCGLRPKWQWAPTEDLLASRNVARLATATSPNDVFVGRVPDRAIDGVAGDNFSQNGWTAINCCDDHGPAILYLEWPRPVRIDAAVLHWSATEPNLFSRGYELASWDGAAWRTLATVTGNTACKRSHNFEQSATTQKMRFLCPKGSRSWAGRNYLQEIELFGGAPFTVQPPPGGDRRVARAFAGEGALTWPAGEAVLINIDTISPSDVEAIEIGFGQADPGVARVSVHAASEGNTTTTLLGQWDDMGGPTVEKPVQGKRVRRLDLRLVPKAGRAISVSKLRVLCALTSGRGQPHRLTCLDVADLDGDGRAELLTGSTNGRAYAIGPSGKTRWTWQTGGTVNHITASDLDLDGKCEVAIASEDGCVYLLDGDGGERWRSRSGSAAYRAEGMTASVAVDLDGDDKRELVVGSKTANINCYAFDAAGEMLWRHPQYGHRCTALAAGDCDGDGKAEVLLGTYYFGSSVLDWRGKGKWSFGGVLPAVSAACMADVNSDGKKEILYGMGDLVRCHTHAGKLRWQRNVGDHAKAIVAGDLDRDRQTEVIVGSRSGYVYALQPNADLKWQHGLRDDVLCLAIADLDHNGQREIVVAAEDGCVHVISAAGTPLARSVAGGYIIGVAVRDLDRDGTAEVVAASTDGRVHVLAPDTSVVH